MSAAVSPEALWIGIWGVILGGLLLVIFAGLVSAAYMLQDHLRRKKAERERFQHIVKEAEKVLRDAE